MNRKAMIVTFGCRLNIADSALLTGRLERSGFQVLESCPDPELIVVNSCAVTAEAAAKCRRKVRQLKREYPAAHLVVTGCAAQLNPEEFRRAGAAEVFPNSGKREFFRQEDETAESRAEIFRENVCARFPFRSRAFIKIQEGCGNFCTYCIVPYVRGPERSRAKEEVLEECRKALDSGFPELVLTGVNTCAYRDGDTDLGALVREIAALPGDFRIRLSSTEPHPKNKELIKVMAQEPKICRFLHLSLQHGCDRILKAMNRHYTAAEFADFADYARENLPGLHLGTDIIAGFPGETEEDFFCGLEFARKMQFANTHVFTYSIRPGTPAATMPDQVDPAVASARHGELQKAADLSARDFALSQCGKELPVIFERDDGKVMRGWSDNYLEITAPSGAFPLRKIVKVKVSAGQLSRLTE